MLGMKGNKRRKKLQGLPHIGDLVWRTIIAEKYEFGMRMSYIGGYARERAVDNDAQH
jgi:hypothetical protein